MPERPLNPEPDRTAQPDDGTRQLLQWGASIVGAGLVAGRAGSVDQPLEELQ